MSDTLKLGPMWDRTVFDGKGRTVKYRMKTLCRYEEITAFKLREYMNAYETVELQNQHPDVQKAPRPAELWLTLKSGKEVLAATNEQAGLLLAAVSPVATSLQLTVQTERLRLEDGKNGARQAG